MRRPLFALGALLALLAGCGEDAPAPPPPKPQALAEADLDRLVDEVLLDEDLPEPVLDDEEIDSLVEDFLMEEETR